MLIVMPLWLWLLIAPLQLVWRVSIWMLVLGLRACNWSVRRIIRAREQPPLQES
jgi:hypothetical protein